MAQFSHTKWCDFSMCLSYLGINELSIRKCFLSYFFSFYPVTFGYKLTVMEYLVCSFSYHNKTIFSVIKARLCFIYWFSGEPNLYFSKCTIKIKVHSQFFYFYFSLRQHFCVKNWNKMTVLKQEFSWRNNSQTDLIWYNNQSKCVKSVLCG